MWWHMIFVGCLRMYSINQRSGGLCKCVQYHCFLHSHFSHAHRRHMINCLTTEIYCTWKCVEEWMINVYMLPVRYTKLGEVSSPHHHVRVLSFLVNTLGLNLWYALTLFTLVSVFTPQGELAYVKRQAEEKDQRISELEESLTGTSLLVRTEIPQHLAYIYTSL